MTDTIKPIIPAKRKLFAERFVVNRQGAISAVEAGYSERRAKQTASELMKDPRVLEIIFAGIEKASKENGIDAAWVLKKAVQYLDTNIMDFLVVPEKGSKESPYFDFSKATEDQLSVLDSVEISPGKFGTKIKVSLPKKKEMLDLVGRHVEVKAFDKTVEHTASSDLMEFLSNIPSTTGPPSER